MKDIHPKTMPSATMLGKINGKTKKLFDAFSPSFIADKLGLPIGTVKSQKSRGKLSPKSATDYCKIREIKAAGFTRELLRPDVKNWYGDDKNK